MKMRTLKRTVLLSFMAVILFLGGSAGTWGFYIIKRNVIDRAQAQVRDDLKVAVSVFEGQIEEIGLALGIVDPEAEPEWIGKKAGLHYVYKVSAQDALTGENPLAVQAVQGIAAGGTRILSAEEVAARGIRKAVPLQIEVKPTPKARPGALGIVRDKMVKEYAVPVFEQGKVKEILVGGRIVNRDDELVDKIRDLVFEHRIYEGKQVGTVTFFQDDVRIATNVMDQYGNRAIGTRVSREVYDNVIGQGKTWLDRAFVVNDWYITGYEPIRGPGGEIIGILYVGVLEKPFYDIARNSLFLYLGIVAGAGVLAIVLALFLAEAIARPVEDMLKATAKISEGDLKGRVKPNTSITELNRLSASFNNMTKKLNDGYGRLKVSNEKLVSLNKSYLDLIGFVSHELKGILSSTILNAYSVRDGFLGMVNFKQQKALDSIARNLDHLDSTVKNFLSLSRIEKGEIRVDKAALKLREDIFDISVDTFSKRISEKDLRVTVEIPEGLEIQADIDLLRVVANNLVSNAVKYGKQGGRIIIRALKREDSSVEAEVYNDGRPISPEERTRLFKRFSRLEHAEVKKEKGTGLGLFITRMIIEGHGGTIDVRPEEKGNTFFFNI